MSEPRALADESRADDDETSTKAARRMAYYLIAPALTTSVLVLVIGLIAAYQLLGQQRRTAELLAVEVASLRTAEELAGIIRQAETHIHRYIISDEMAHLDHLPELRRESSWRLDELRRLDTTDREHALLIRLDAAQARFWDGIADLDSADEAVDPAWLDRADETLSLIQTYLEINQDLVETASQRNHAISRSLAISLLLLGVLGSLTGLFVGFLVARAIRRSIIQLSVPVYDAAGKLNEVVGPITVSPRPGVRELESLLQEVSEKVGMVIERLAQSRLEVLRSEQLAVMGRLAAGLAHEIRNPLTAMKILIQSASERGHDLGGRHLTVLEEEIRRLERLIRTFLDFAGPPTLEKRRFDLRNILEQKLVLVSGRADLKRLTIETDLPPDPLMVEADPAQVRQLVLNLLLNALDASPEGGTVRIRVARGIARTIEGAAPPDGLADVRPESAASWITIEVADCGRGLPPNIGERLYEPFFTTKQNGVGLGLPISKQIVEAHGGTILASDRATGGAVFTVWLPIGA